MASLLRSSRPAGALKGLLRPTSARTPKYHHHHHRAGPASATALAPPPAAPYSIPRTTTTTTMTTAAAAAGFHTSAARGDNVARASGGGRGSQLDSLDVLGSTPVPSTSVDVCMSSGFKLNSGARVVDGSGVVLVGGEAFEWRPWLASSSSSSSSSSSAAASPRLVNAKGQWDIPAAALGLLAVVWPRPDLLILGVGPEIRPISPELRKAISALGMRVDVLDTHNAAAQFNLLVRERGVDDVAAALIPIGWKEGVGAGTMEDEPDLSHE